MDGISVLRITIMDIIIMDHGVTAEDMVMDQDMAVDVTTVDVTTVAEELGQHYLLVGLLLQEGSLEPASEEEDKVKSRFKKQ